ncbi:AP-1 complex subunit gamma-1, partial [Phenoliferia sp. Uapishka_3]
MLGYPAHFGQIECLKLVASPRFTDKRLGYLGIMLLLDENQEVLTLVTNSLKNDMNHTNASVVSLALCTFANISSEEMARDLVTEVERCLGSGNAYIRKKAALAALRCLYKVPELVDHFEGRATSLLSDRNHGVLLTGVTLVTEMCRLVGGEPFRKAVPLLVRHLKALVTTGYSPEHDVSGITDPFLQVRLDQHKISAKLSLRLECLRSQLTPTFPRSYVALNTLNKVVGVDTNAVQRHRSIILDCLRDGDISIRRRALELSYALINESNVRVLIRELLAFLEVADNEFKLAMTTQVCAAAEKFAPNRRWHIDTVLRVLKLVRPAPLPVLSAEANSQRSALCKAGNFVREEVLSGFIRLVAHTSELQSYTVFKLYTALRADVSQESLTLAGVWVIGEFGDVLLQGGTVAGTGEEDESATTSDAVGEKDVVDLMDNILISPYTNNGIRAFVLTAVTKLSTRFSDPSQLARIRGILHQFDQSIELELQQRAIEFGMLLTMDGIKTGVLERMPPPELKPTVMGTASEKKPVGSLRRDKDALLDLMGDESAPAAGAIASVPQGQTTQDLLADIFGTNDDPPSSAPALSPTGNGAPAKSSMNDILGLFDSTSISSPTTAPSPYSSPPPTASSPMGDLFSAVSSTPGVASPPIPRAPQEHEVYSQHGLRITLTGVKDSANPLVANILAKFTSTQPISGVSFQAAVPKAQRLQMMAMSRTDVAPGSTETQQLRVMVQAPGSIVRLRLRIAFSAAGSPVQDQTDFTFEKSLL